MNWSGPAPTRKWPGIPMPSSRRPRRRLTSIMSTLKVIGIPRWRRSTSSRNELRGVGVVDVVAGEPSVGKEELGERIGFVRCLSGQVVE